MSLVFAKTRNSKVFFYSEYYLKKKNKIKEYFGKKSTQSSTLKLIEEVFKYEDILKNLKNLINSIMTVQTSI